MSIDSEVITKGTLVDGRYEIRERLGQGGMGMVYRALDKKLNQMVALKVLLHGTGSERSKEERRRRFMHEIYAINEVEHRNVVHIQEFGFFRETPYMVMELLKGKDLNRILKENGDLLPIDYCVDVMLVVSAAIQACHDRGVIHRDLKPGNIMVIDSDSGHGWDVKVVDFSISKAASDLTKDGQIVGTPNYLSPEQVSGKVVPASDQYALALLLYVCLTKRHPFEDLDGLPLIRAIERGEIKKPRTFRPDIPEELEQIIMKAMHIDPAQRFGRIREFGQKIWPFGSQLGQGVWKKYYFETPLDYRPRSDATRSTTGIPLVLQIAQGKVPMSAATVVVDYQRTTAVQGATGTGQSATTTMDDPDARAAAEGDPGAVSGSVKTLDDPEARPFAKTAASSPSGSQWRESLSQASGLSSSGQGERSPAGKRRVALVAVGLALGMVGIFAAGRAVRRPSVAAEPTGIVQPREQSAAPAIPPPLSPSVAAAKPTPNPGTPADNGATAEPAAASAPADGREEKSKRGEHSHARRKTRKPADWATDPSGNPIPPM
jgi:serine/threonine protein kinase